jgi:hypothetical protein
MVVRMLIITVFVLLGLTLQEGLKTRGVSRAGQLENLRLEFFERNISCAVFSNLDQKHMSHVRYTYCMMYLYTAVLRTLYTIHLETKAL